jgi:hypothetical protein
LDNVSEDVKACPVGRTEVLGLGCLHFLPLSGAASPQTQYGRW